MSATLLALTCIHCCVSLQEVIAAVYSGPGDGAKKVISDHEMPDAYHPGYVEAAWQEWW